MNNHLDAIHLMNYAGEAPRGPKAAVVARRLIR